MSRAHLYRTVQALGGSLVSGASVTVCEPGTTTPIAQVLHDSEAGAGTLSNPFLATGGIIDFYLDNAQDVDLVISYGSSTRTVPYQGVMRPAGEIFAAGSPVTVTTSPSAGNLLSATDATHAAWAAPGAVVPGLLDTAMPQPSDPIIAVF